MDITRGAAEKQSGDDELTICRSRSRIPRCELWRRRPQKWMVNVVFERRKAKPLRQPRRIDPVLYPPVKAARHQLHATQGIRDVASAAALLVVHLQRRSAWTALLTSPRLDQPVMEAGLTDRLWSMKRLRSKSMPLRQNRDGPKTFKKGKLLKLARGAAVIAGVALWVLTPAYAVDAELTSEGWPRTFISLVRRVFRSQTGRFIGGWNSHFGKGKRRAAARRISTKNWSQRVQAAN